MERLKLFTTKQVQEILHCKHAKIIKLIKAQRLKAYANGRTYLFSEENINSYLKSVEI